MVSFSLRQRILFCPFPDTRPVSFRLRPFAPNFFFIFSLHMHKCLLTLPEMKTVNPKQIRSSLTVIALLVFTIFLRSPAQAQAVTFGTGTNTFSIDFVHIGNAGNAADTRTGDGSLGRGSVPYEYKIGTYEITDDAIIKATASGLSNVTTFWTGNTPARSISWYEAAAFVNWLNTSTGKTAAYNLTFTTSWSMALWSSEQAWTAGGTNLYRNKDAFYFLPNDNEWYKAAYYNPGGSNYFLYPTASDSAPTGVFSGTNAGTAVYFTGTATNTPNWPAEVFSSGGLSPYGTMGQGGNMAEWLESAFDGTNDSTTENRVRRGGLYNSGGSALESARGRSSENPTTDNFLIGYGRVASIPEPSTAVLVLLGAGALYLWKRRQSSL
jgi:hypothetical protein